jgi:hypothetical protein
MRVQITASAVTVYQTKSLANLCGLGCLRNPDGSYSYCFEYQTKREAIQWLIGRAYGLAYDSKELSEMIAQIKKYGQLTVDATTARIERISPKTGHKKPGEGAARTAKIGPKTA